MASRTVAPQPMAPILGSVAEVVALAQHRGALLAKVDEWPDDPAMDAVADDRRRVRVACRADWPDVTPPRDVAALKAQVSALEDELDDHGEAVEAAMAAGDFSAVRRLRERREDLPMLIAQAQGDVLTAEAENGRAEETAYDPLLASLRPVRDDLDRLIAGLRSIRGDVDDAITDAESAAYFGRNARANAEGELNRLRLRLRKSMERSMRAAVVA